jgi:glycerate dehydrogenase
MQRIVFLERDTVEAEFRVPNFPHEWIDFAASRQSEVVERLQGASIAVCNKLRICEAELAQLPELKLIAVAATGVNNIDLAACRKRGVRVANVRNYAHHSLPEHVLMLMLALRRNLVNYRADIERGLWQQAAQFCLHTHVIRDLHHSTLGIIGYGALGRAVGKMGRALGMRVLISEHKDATTIRYGRTSFAKMLRASDVVSLHCPLTDETRNLIGAAEFELMKRDALLINTARGGLVDEAALVSALREGKIAGAGFDVLSVEPPHEDHPLLSLRLPNFILTPHVAWASREAMQTLADQLIDNLEAFVKGVPQNLVT